MDLSLLPKRSDKKGGKKQRKYGRNRAKCARYRNRVGKPNGPGQSGNRSH